MQQRAKYFAARHGFKVRRVPHSQQSPNGYVKIIAPDGREYKAVDWGQAWQLMMELAYRYDRQRTR